MNYLSSCQYYLLRKRKEPIQWDIYNTVPQSDPEFFWTRSDYYAKVLQRVDQLLKIEGLVFYITFDQLDILPSYGEHVVVVMVGDEGCHIPRYFHRVLAVFKPYGITPFLGCNPLLNPSSLNILSFVQFLKLWLHRFPDRILYWSYHLRQRLSSQPKPGNIFTIPLGYYKQVDLAIQDLEGRQHDIFFAGSVRNDTYVKGSLKDWITRWIKPPKVLAREQMVGNVNRLRQKRPDLKIELALTDGFFSANAANARTYSEQLMNAKICLVPRGTSFETYRFFEAMRYGCIVLTEALPSRWFYDGSPAVTVKNWSHLGQLVEDIIDNKDLIRQKHQEAIRWWHHKCSPTVTGEYIVQILHRCKTSAANEMS
jgi:hypothetical protein